MLTNICITALAFVQQCFPLPEAAKINIANAGFETPAKPAGKLQMPDNWFSIQHAGTLAYYFTVDDTVSSTGKQSMKIERHTPQIYGTVLQRINAVPFRGKKIKLNAKVKLDKVGEDGAGIYLMIFTPGSNIAEYDIKNGKRRGTLDWTAVSTDTLTVPSNATEIEVALSLNDAGIVWGDDFVLEIVK
jgi:hypothetical protein